MGYFQAYRIADDQPVVFTDEGIEVGLNVETPSVEKYYKGIITSALLTRVEFVTQESEFFEFTTTNYRARNKKKLLNLLTDEESKYYWAWKEGDQFVVGNNDLINPILTHLKMVNVWILNNVFYYEDRTYQGPPGRNYPSWQRSIFGQVKEGSEEHIQDPAIKLKQLSENSEEVEKFKYRIDNLQKAFFLFLDTIEKTKNYKFQVVDGPEPPLIYEIQKTYRFVGEKEVGLISASDHDCFFKERRLARYYFCLITELKKREKLNLDRNKIEDFLKTEEDLWEKYPIPDIGEAEKLEIENAAFEAACKLPKEGGLMYNCFYYASEGMLNGFVSKIFIGEYGRGGIGYAMRADKLNEINYRWWTSISRERPSIEHYYLMILQSYLIGLDSRLYFTDLQFIRIKNDADGYFPTNSPHAELNKDSKHPIEGDEMELWFQYFKKFKELSAKEKRNEPKSEYPFPPRISNSKFQDYDYYYGRAEIKLSEHASRVWKKQKRGKKLELAFEKSPREAAGNVMANALKRFGVVEKIENSAVQKPKVSSSNLPATALAKYLLDTDPLVQDQWKNDKKLGLDKDINQESLKTNQEWCHLFGHGDGGTEELGNFVSGSKHCNTEQLAIETGQRRISHQSKAFFDEMGVERKDLTVRVTAYLFPNNGVWNRKKEVYSFEDLNRKLYTGLDEETAMEFVNQVINDFFGIPEDGSYKLKNSIALRTSFKKLTDEYKNARTEEEKLIWFQLRHNVETHFFLYLPLARWMRYKIYYQDKIVFDHFYDAQSESFSLHECKILDDAVERAIYLGMNKKDQYVEVIRERAEKLAPSKEEATLIELLLRLNEDYKKFRKNYEAAIVQIDYLSSSLEGLKQSIPSLESRWKDINLQPFSVQLNEYRFRSFQYMVFADQEREKYQNYEQQVRVCGEKLKEMKDKDFKNKELISGIYSEINRLTEKVKSAINEVLLEKNKLDDAIKSFDQGLQYFEKMKATREEDEIISMDIESTSQKIDETRDMVREVRRGRKRKLEGLSEELVPLRKKAKLKESAQLRRTVNLVAVPLSPPS